MFIMQRNQYIDWCIQEERRVTWQVTYLGCFGLITIYHSAGSPSFCEESRRFFSLTLTNPKEADRSEFLLLPGIMIPVFEGLLLLKILSLWSFHVLVALNRKFCFLTSSFTLGSISDNLSLLGRNFSSSRIDVGEKNLRILNVSIKVW